jgi:hypothetical protein
MYTSINYKTKKAFREAVAAGHDVTLYQPGPFGSDVRDGRHTVEGPHYPAPHSWYAKVVVSNGRVITVK